MTNRGRPPKIGGAVYRRKESRVLAGRLQGPERRGHTRVGKHIRSSRRPSGSSDRFWTPETRGRLATVLTSKQLTFNQWADWFRSGVQNRHSGALGITKQNMNALKFLRPVFGELSLSEITAEAVENYLAHRLESGRRIHTKLGLQFAREDQTGNHSPGIQDPVTHFDGCG